MHLLPNTLIHKVSISGVTLSLVEKIKLLQPVFKALVIVYNNSTKTCDAIITVT